MGLGWGVWRDWEVRARAGQLRTSYPPGTLASESEGCSQHRFLLGRIQESVCLWNKLSGSEPLKSQSLRSDRTKGLNGG